MSIGVNIKKRRLELRMSQQDLASAMGYKTRSTIAKIESGENDVSQKKLLKFALILDTTIESLISGITPAEAHLSILPTNTEDSARNKNIVIILAGGKSGRNLQNIPSQFINIHDRPILVHCMDAYQAHPLIDDIYVVCLKGWESIVKAYAHQYGITKLKDLIPAGNTGILSLKNAFDYIKSKYNSDDMIIIQESTRPMVSVETISKLLQVCAEKGTATICHSMHDYVQFNLEGTNATYIDRNSIVALQSPEGHRLALMAEVFETAEKKQHPLTESCCTMLLYNLGYDINFIQSNINNIKIVREEDLAAFSALVKN